MIQILTYSDGMICGGLAVDICPGDSGGPVVANIDGRFRLIGISSFVRTDTSCGSKVPGVFADVSHPEILTFINYVY